MTTEKTGQCVVCWLPLDEGTEDGICLGCAESGRATELIVSLRQLQAIVNRDGGQKSINEAKEAAVGYLSRIQELEEQSSVLADVWKKAGDWPLPEDAEIDRAHPLRSRKHDLYQEAARLVSAKRSKFALVALVNWLLLRLFVAEERAKKLERIREAAYIYAKPSADFAAPEEMARRRAELVEALKAMRETVLPRT